jgi:hypothetical protein
VVDSGLLTLTFIDQCSAILKCVLDNLGASSPVGALRVIEMVSLSEFKLSVALSVSLKFKFRRPVCSRLDSWWRIDSLVGHLLPLLKHGSKHVRAMALHVYYSKQVHSECKLMVGCLTCSALSETR